LLGLSLLRVRRQLLAALLLVAIVTSSCLAFILVPSLSANLSTGLTGYSNQVATYIVAQIDWNGNQAVGSCINDPAACSLLSPQLVDRMSTLPGVEKSYVAESNVVWLTFTLTNLTGRVCSDGVCVTQTNQTQHMEGEMVAGVLGNGTGSYPPALVTLSSGRLPREGAAEFVVLSSFVNQGITLTVGKNYTFHANLSHRNFTSTLVGIEQLNPLLAGTGIFFDATFMKNLLGPGLYTQTFGSSGANLVVLKAATSSDVQPIADNVTKLLTIYPYYTVTYDAATIANLRAYDQQTAPLYLFLSGVAIVSAAAATMLVCYLGIGKREWEAGLLVSQGWSWSDLTKYFSYYYLPIMASGWAVAAILSYVIGPNVAFGFTVYGSTLTLSAYPVLTFVVLGLAVMLALAFISSGIAVRRLRKKGLDEILREM
jgi:hypothetical protein